MNSQGLLKAVNQEILVRFSPGGGVTTIYAGTGCAIFSGAFF